LLESETIFHHDSYPVWFPGTESKYLDRLLSNLLSQAVSFEASQLSGGGIVPPAPEIFGLLGNWFADAASNNKSGPGSKLTTRLIEKGSLSLAVIFNSGATSWTHEKLLLKALRW
jgi:hypothetical protein